MLSEDFEIYYYSDTNLRNVAGHTHDYYEFYFFLSGAVSIQIADMGTQLKAGDIILIPPGTSHHLDILDSSVPYQRFIFWISEDYYNNMLQRSDDYSYIIQKTLREKKYIYHFDTFIFKALQNRIIALLEEVNSKRYGRDTKLSLCVGDLVLSLNRYAFEASEKNRIIEPNSICEGIIGYVDAHITENITLDMLARELFVSKYYIAHAFKESLGISIHQYIIKKRLALSREAIFQCKTIAEVQKTCGFNDYPSFYRAFKKEYGISPKEFKESHGNFSF